MVLLPRNILGMQVPMDPKAKVIVAGIVLTWMSVILPDIGRAAQKPEIIITHSNKKQVVDTLVNLMLDKGFTVKSVNEYNAIF